MMLSQVMCAWLQHLARTEGADTGPAQARKLSDGDKDCVRGKRCSVYCILESGLARVQQTCEYLESKR